MGISKTASTRERGNVFCHECGLSVRPEDMHCGSCGALLTRPSEGKAQKLTSPDPRRRWGAWFMASAAVLVIVLGVLLGVLLGGRMVVAPANRVQPLSESSSGTTVSSVAETSTIPTTESGASAEQTMTYANDALGYGFEFPAGWTVSESSDAEGAAGSTAAAHVTVFDPAGAVAEGTYIDLVGVSAYQLNFAVDERLSLRLRLPGCRGSELQ
jgi:hypothetical protein